MLLNPDRYWWLIPASFFAAFLWQFWPLSHATRQWTPNAIVLVTLYWTLRRPQHVSSGWAFIIGLSIDGIEGSPPGMHALALVAISYVVQILGQRLRLLGIWQQVPVVTALCILNLMICSWVQLLYPHGNHHTYWLPALSSGASWPILYLLLRKLEQGSTRSPAST